MVGIGLQLEDMEEEQQEEMVLILNILNIVVMELLSLMEDLPHQLLQILDLLQQEVLVKEALGLGLMMVAPVVAAVIMAVEELLYQLAVEVLDM